MNVERGAAINYEFENMVIEMSQDAGPNAARATRKMNGKLRVTPDKPGSPTRPG